MTKKEELVSQLELDYKKADLSPADLAMLEYSAMLTLSPSDIGQKDIQVLRDAGFEDRAILDIALIVS